MRGAKDRDGVTIELLGFDSPGTTGDDVYRWQYRMAQRGAGLATAVDLPIGLDHDRRIGRHARGGGGAGRLGNGVEGTVADLIDQAFPVVDLRMESL